MFETKTAFEPVSKVVAKDTGDVIEALGLYERVDYSILACNCGDTIKRRIREEINERT